MENMFRMPYWDCTVGLLTLPGDAKAERFSRAIAAAFDKLDGSYELRPFQLTGSENPDSFSAFGFLLVPGFSTAAREAVLCGMSVGTIPLVPAGCGWEGVVPSECLWQKPEDIPDLLARIHFSPETFACTQETCRRLNPNATPAAVTGTTSLLDRFAPNIKDMPTSNGCRYYTRFKTRIGIVCDQFYWDSVKDAANFVYLSPDVDEATLKGLDCLLMVTAWTGLKDEEWRGISTAGRPRRVRAEQIIETCRKHNVPTIFYSKEDPPNYDLYVGLAQKCDYVFTSAEECVQDYKRDCGHDHVYVMRFCINPIVHNPIGIRNNEKQRNFIFSGSWMEKYPHRCKDLKIIFDGILASGREMNIVDRNYGSGNPQYTYPEQYQRFLSPAIPHEDLQRIHRLFDWAVNINTVKDSMSMFANRVYELQASGNLLISNYSLGVSNLLPTVFLVHDSNEIPRIVNSFTTEEVYERQVSGVRRVMTGETCFDRIGEMLEIVGLKAQSSQRKVLVVADEITGSIQKAFNRQSYANKILRRTSEVTDSEYEEVDAIAFFDKDANYGVFYLEDMINAFKYVDCDYVTKDASLRNGVLQSGVEFDYVNQMQEKSRTVFWRASFKWTELKSISHCAIPHGFSIDHFNYEIGASKIVSTNAPELTVILPCYNNGWFLYGRSFASLRRSSIFNRMKILIVDDGSTDGFTPYMAEYLAELYPNVQAIFCPRGGSGTAARARNAGLDVVKTRYVAFLDPDDEIINDGYGAMFNEIEKEGCDFVLCNMDRMRDSLQTLDFYSKIVGAYGSAEVKDGRQLLLNTSFVPANIQTMIIKKDFIDAHNLRQVVGGSGEDSLFYQQMMFYAKHMRVIPVSGQMYYAERADSVVHAIDEEFFDRHLPTERYRLKWMKQIGLIDDYMKLRFRTYMKGWHFVKLGYVKQESRLDCCRKVLEILDMYADFYHGGDADIDAFISTVRKGCVDPLFGKVIPVPKIISAKTRTVVLPESTPFEVPPKGKFYELVCNVSDKSMVYVSGGVTERGCEMDRERAMVMVVQFSDKDGSVLKNGHLSKSQAWGEYVYVTSGAGQDRVFRWPIEVPKGSEKLALRFTRWAAKNTCTVSKLKVMALGRN